MNVLTHLSGDELFRTARLHCRKWRPDDAASLLAVYGDPEGARWVDDGQPIKREECEEWLVVTDRNYAQRGYGMFALEASSSGEVVGFCGLVHPGGQAEAEVKYAFIRSHWGRGLASEAVPALLDYGRREFGLDYIIATVAVENVASQRVLLKSGLKLIKEAQDEHGLPMLVFAWQES